MPILLSSPAPNTTKADVSWWVFGTLLAATLFVLGMLEYITLYTEGEVVQALFRLLFAVVGGGAILTAWFRRTTALWLLAVTACPLICWQSWQIRKWAMIQEDVQGIIQQSRAYKQDHGIYPPTKKVFVFANPSIASHIGYSLAGDQDFRLDYFVNNSGITYWYTPAGGFGYYPD